MEVGKSLIEEESFENSKDSCEFSPNDHSNRSSNAANSELIYATITAPLPTRKPLDAGAGPMITIQWAQGKKPP